jgi:hypothetical protein
MRVLVQRGETRASNSSHEPGHGPGPRPRTNRRRSSAALPAASPGRGGPLLCPPRLPVHRPSGGLCSNRAHLLQSGLTPACPSLGAGRSKSALPERFMAGERVRKERVAVYEPVCVAADVSRLTLLLPKEIRASSRRLLRFMISMRVRPWRSQLPMNPHAPRGTTSHKHRTPGE